MINVILVAPQIKNDLPTKITTDWAVQLSGFIKANSDYTLAAFLREDAVRSKVEDALRRQKNQPGFFVFLDHGDRDVFIGSDERRLIDAGNVDLLRNKLIYTISCKSAASLGYEALKEGAVGYIGFNNDFRIEPYAPTVFGHCFLAGLKSLMRGCVIQESIMTVNVKKARERVKNEMSSITLLLDTVQIPATHRYKIARSLRHNMDSMVWLGDLGWV